MTKLETLSLPTEATNLRELIENPQMIAVFAETIAKDTLKVSKNSEKSHLETPEVTAVRIAESAVKLAVELLIVGEME